MPTDFYGGVGVDLLYPSQLGMNQFSEPEWSSANIAPLPATDYSASESYSTTPADSRPPAIEVSAVPPHMANVPRPKSSPSTFGNNVEDLYFPQDPFKFRQDDFNNAFFPSPQASGKSSPYFGAQDYQPQGGSRGASPARQMPVPIAPDPVGMRQLQSMKRGRDEDDAAAEQLGQQRKRKRAVSSTGPVELNEEETLLLKLKEEESLPWKDIAARFQSDLGKTYQVPALQMRFKRLRERMRAWTENDASKKPMLNGRPGAYPYGRVSTSAPPNGMPAAGRPYAAPRGGHDAYRPMPLPPTSLPGYGSQSLYPTGPAGGMPYPSLSPSATFPPPSSYSMGPAPLQSAASSGVSYPAVSMGHASAQWARC